MTVWYPAGSSGVFSRSVFAARPVFATVSAPEVWIARPIP